MRRKNENKSSRPHMSLTFMFSGAAILSITFSTVLVFSVMWYFSSDNTIALQDVSVYTMFFLTLFMSVIITFTLRKIFISPLITLTNAMNKVAAGDFSIRLDCDSSQDDLTEVYSSFNTMVNELSQTDTLQTDFISNVSHEFKTPINAIEGYASLLQDISLTEDEEKIYVDKIIFNTKRLSDLVGNVLLLSKISNNSVTEEANNYRLDEQIRYSILALESKWTIKNIDFDIALDEINYYGLESTMSHVWVNLIDNAIKFSNNGGGITIRLYKQDNNAVFTVFNTGISIQENSIDRIFNKFYQCDTSHKSEGNGLGLPLVRMILDNVGGSIHVKSSKDSGTEFTVHLPLSSRYN